MKKLLIFALTILIIINSLPAVILAAEADTTGKTNYALNGEVIARPEVTISNSNLTGTHKSIYYTDFTEDTHIACVWLWEHVSLISDTGEVLLATSIPERATINEFLYMNHDYVYVRTKDEERIYQILK